VINYFLLDCTLMTYLCFNEQSLLLSLLCNNVPTKEKRRLATGIFFMVQKFISLDKNDLRAFGHIHEIAGGDHTVDAGEEIFLFDAEHVHGHLAAVHLGAAI